jgi:hypothetical protein
MKLIAFKLIQTAAILLGWLVMSAGSMVAAPVLLAWSSTGLLAEIWSFKPKKGQS